MAESARRQTLTLCSPRAGNASPTEVWEPPPLATDLRKISVRSWIKLARWTVLGTLGCMVVSLAFNYVAFAGFPSDAKRQGLISAAIIPVILAGPLFFYLTLKLRELKIVNHKLNVTARNPNTGTDCRTSSTGNRTFSARRSRADARCFNPRSPRRERLTW